MKIKLPWGKLHRTSPSSDQREGWGEQGSCLYFTGDFWGPGETRAGTSLPLPRAACGSDVEVRKVPDISSLGLQGRVGEIGEVASHLPSQGWRESVLHVPPLGRNKFTGWGCCISLPQAGAGGTCPSPLFRKQLLLVEVGGCMSRPPHQSRRRRRSGCAGLGNSCISRIALSLKSVVFFHRLSPWESVCQELLLCRNAVCADPTPGLFHAASLLQFG